MAERFNLENDLREIVTDLAKEIRLKISASKPLHDTIVDYLTVYRKLIPIKHREVFVCPELVAELFSHPKAREIHAIIRIAKQGGNLNPFQNARLFQTNFHDHMIAEWNIYHFHLSLVQENKSYFVKQVNALLFAYITDSYIVFLGTACHGKDVFGNQKWWELLHNNFPQLVQEFKLNAIDIAHQLSADERQKLWNAGINTGMTKVKDTIYYSPNMGRTCSGHNLMVIHQSNAIVRWVKTLSKQLSEFYDQICRTIHVNNSSSQFKICWFGGNFILAEISSKQQVLKFNEQFDVSRLAEHTK